MFVFRVDPSVLLLRADWSKYWVKGGQKVADFIVVQAQYRPAEDAWTSKVVHTISESKDQDTGFTALGEIIKAHKGTNARTKVFLFTDGGRADFKCADFIYSMYCLQDAIQLRIIHIVLAPYHGHGPADAAKAQANKKLKNWFLNENEVYHNLETVANVFNTVENHQAIIFPQLTRRPPSPRFIGCSLCFQFTYDTEEHQIFGYHKATFDADAVPDYTWTVVRE